MKLPVYKYYSEWVVEELPIDRTNLNGTGTKVIHIPTGLCADCTVYKLKVKNIDFAKEQILEVINNERINN